MYQKYWKNWKTIAILIYKFGVSLPVISLLDLFPGRKCCELKSKQKKEQELKFVEGELLEKPLNCVNMNVFTVSVLLCVR